MTNTPDDIQQRIIRYYEATSEGTYLGSWAPTTYAVHFGMDEGDGVTHEQALARTNAYLAERLGVGPGMRLLDAGCGLGSTSIWMARERGAEITAINIVEHQLEHARRLARENGVGDRIRFARMDYAALDFEEASLDAIWNLESFCHAADPGGYLRTVTNRLRAGGRYGCLDFFRASDRPSKDLDDLCDGWVLPSLLTLDSAERLLRDAGLDRVEVHVETPRILRSAERMLAMASMRMKQFAAAQVFGEEVDPVAEGHARAAVGAARAFASGELLYAFLTGVRP